PAFVRRSEDSRLERSVGTDAGLRLVFAGMSRRFRASRANGFEGDIHYDLKADDGTPKPWVVSVRGERASARPGRATEPKLRLALSLADFVRLISRDLEPGKALMSGRLELEGDFAVASQLGEMFGE